MSLIIDSRGGVRCLHGEAIDLNALGSLTIIRANHVEPDVSGAWWAELLPVGGPCLGPFAHRLDSLAAEQIWLESHWLDPHSCSAC